MPEHVQRLVSPVTLLRFAVGSCQYPAGLLDKDPAYRTYGRIAQRLQQADAPGLLLLVGDQVYVDATAGLFDPALPEEKYERPYKVLYTQPPVSAVGRRLQGVYCMMDDHELVDNWEPIGPKDPPDYGELIRAVDGYTKWERAQGPIVPAPPAGGGTAALHFTLDRPPVRFFVADTRTERKARNAATVDSAKIMSDAQFKALCTWLTTGALADAPKVIASPSILLPRRLWADGHPAYAIRSDAWDGYRRSLHGLLAYIAKNKVTNAVFVSGDEHICCFTRATIRKVGEAGAGTVLHSIHSSPMYAPYPFANSVPEDLIGNETFCFSDPDVPADRYECTVQTAFPDCGNAFALITLEQANGQWGVKCEFSGENGSIFYPQP
jgi:cholesterol oxidase